MKKTTITAIIVAIAAVGIVAAYVFLPKAETYQQEQATTEAAAPSTSTGSNPSATPKSPGSYIDYTSDIIAKTSGTKVLFFHAPWCPQCRALDASIKAGAIPTGVTIIKVDYDTNQALRQKYGVTTQTTLVRVDDNGNLVKKYVAYDSPSLAALIQNAL